MNMRRKCGPAGLLLAELAVTQISPNSGCAGGYTVEMHTAVRRQAIVGLLFLSGLLTACGSSTPVAPDQSSVPFSITELTVGTGAEAVVGSTASISYELWLYEESAPDKKGTGIGPGSFSFLVGLGQVIPGFDQGVAGMKVGGVRRVIVPPSMAYGAVGNGPIPPNAALVFDITLLSVQ
jgi:FKBP-type peptidyl-prolyl cis-trans isomerase FkpA